MTLFIAFLGGILPALIWLAFWTREDAEHPEPKALIAKTFFYGMIAVPAVLVVQLMVSKFYLEDKRIPELLETMAPLAYVAIIGFAFAEEAMKLFFARAASLASPENDEAVDSVVYMIAAALGFAAMENVLYLIAPLLASDAFSALIDGNLRFIGATLLHVASSAIVGMCIGFAKFRADWLRVVAPVIGLVGATALHSAYNLFIITHEQFRMAAFIMVWTASVVLILVFERIKRIHLNPITTSYEEA